MCRAKSAQRQRGAVLIISIILLVVLTLLGLYLSQTGILELRMADNAASRSIAFQRAERGRSTAEGSMKNLADRISKNSGLFDCQAEGIGYYAATTLGTNGCKPLVRGNLKWDATDSLVLKQNADVRYVVEFLGIDKIPKTYFDKEVGNNSNDCINVYIFRILSRGRDQAGGEVILESIYTARQGDTQCA